MEPLKNADRTVDWKLSAEEVAWQVRMSDSSPGAIATLLLKEDGQT
jgi:methionyl-tRNA formyltransferase